MENQSNIRIVIVEDELPAGRFLSRRLLDLGYEAEVILNSVSEAVDWFSNHPNPDLIFLDIQLSDGLSFEIFEKVEVKSSVIFTTSYDQYALKAFELNSIDYLLKPIDVASLQKAIDKYQNIRSLHSDSRFDFATMKALLLPTQKTNYRNRLTVKIGSNLKVLPISDIMFFFSENKGVFIYTKEHRIYDIDQTLEQLEQDLNPTEFFRISRKFLVAAAVCTEIHQYSNSRLEIVIPQLKYDESLVVSRERVPDFRAWLQI